jgi:hypothetical protein
MVLAPIVLFVYNRPLHTERTLLALKKNKLANESKLFIFCDGPKENASSEQLEKLKQVRSICHQQQWCAKTTIIDSEKNKGLAKSVIDGVTQIVNEYGKVIVLEDDIECDESFLNFMNNALEHYQNDTKVGGITGFSFDEDAALDDYFFLPIASSWSWATWKRVWDNYESSSLKILDQIESNKLTKKFNFGGYDYTQMLKDQLSGLVDSWAIRFYGSVFLKQQYFLFPRKTLVENIGFDNSGTHCNDNNPFGYRLEQHAIEYNFPQASLIKMNVRIIEKAFGKKLLKSKPKNKLNVLLTRIEDSLKLKVKKLINPS